MYNKILNSFLILLVIVGLLVIYPSNVHAQAGDPVIIELDTLKGNSLNVGITGYSQSVHHVLTIDWGDGQTTVSQLPRNTTSNLHTYNTHGVYEVKIYNSTGTVDFLQMTDGRNTRLMLTRIKSYGDIGLKNIGELSLRAENLIDVPNQIPQSVTSLRGAFYDAYIFNDPDVILWDTSNITDFEFLFYDARAFNQDITGWDVSNVTKFVKTFDGASVFNQDVSLWDITGATTMSYMFANTSLFNQDLSTWDVSNVTNMSNMFNDADGFNQDISAWDVSNVTDFSYMFYSTQLFNQDIGVWDTSSATNLSGMFQWARDFDQDLSMWDTSNVTNMAALFANSKVDFDLSGWDTSQVTNMQKMFSYNTKISQDLTSWDTSSLTNISGIFEYSRFNGDVSTWDISNVTHMTSFAEGSLFFNQDISGWDTSSAIYMSSLFKNSKQFNQDISSWDTSNAINMSAMFSQAEVFDQDISSWDFSKVTNMTNFYYDLTNPALSYSNYKALLNAFDQQKNTMVLNPGSNIHFRGLYHTASDQTLIDNLPWNIIDEGQGFLLQFQDYDGSIIKDGGLVSDGDSLEAPLVNPVRTGYTFTGWDVLLTDNKITVDGADMVAVAQYTPNSYTISFDTNEGSNISDVSYEFETQTTAPVNPTKYGFQFDGWYKDQALTIPHTFDQMPDTDLTLYAKWMMGNFTISFDSNGGTIVFPMTTTYADEITEPVSPTKNYHVFEGWYLDSGLTSSFVFDTMPGVDTLLYAKWVPNTYTITFETNGGTDIPNLEVAYQAVITQPSEPEKTGYTFEGWYSDQTLTTPYVFGTMPHEDFNLYANYTINTYTLTFMDDGIEVFNQTFDYNEDLSHLTTPIPNGKTGYTFDTWSLALPSNMPANNLTITANYTINTYTLTFMDDGIEVFNQTFDFNEDLTSITVPSPSGKTGYTFDQWDQTLPDQMPSSNLVIHALYIVNTYTLIFIDEGIEVYNETFDYNDDLSGVMIPTPNGKVGHSFDSWSFNLPDQMPAYNLNITAVYEPNTYSLIFMDEGDIIFNQTFNYNEDLSSVIPPSGLTKTGYSFDGWDQTVPSNMPVGNLIINAVYLINTYNLIFIDDGIEVYNETFDYNEDLSEVTIPTPNGKTGYTFIGWNETLPSTMPDTHVEVTAMYEINTYTLIYIDEGIEVFNQTFDYNEDLNEVIIPTPNGKIGYTFSAWSFNLPDFMPAYDLTITAGYDINTYSLIFIDEGTIIFNQTFDYNADLSLVIPPSGLTKTGHSFDGWDQIIPSNMPAGNLTINAVYEILSYTLIFIDEGVEVFNQTFDYDADLSEVIIPTPNGKTGYTFSGWDDALPSTMPASHIEITAMYEINTYTLIYIDEGIEIYSENFDYNEDLSGITVPTPNGKVGYSFDGWDQVMPINMPASDVTITATYTINTYTITLVDAGVVIKTLTFEYGAAVEINQPTKTNHNFNGWNPSVPTTMGTENLILNATWTSIQVASNDVTVEVGNINHLNNLFVNQQENLSLKIHLERMDQINWSEATYASDIKTVLGTQIIQVEQYNITLVLESDGITQSEINTLDEVIRITIYLDDSSNQHTTYYVLRIHNGEVEKLETTYDLESQTITFETDKFSTFMLFTQKQSGSHWWWLLLLLVIPISYFTYKYYDNLDDDNDVKKRVKEISKRVAFWNKNKNNKV